MKVKLTIKPMFLSDLFKRNSTLTSKIIKNNVMVLGLILFMDRKRGGAMSKI